MMQAIQACLAVQATDSPAAQLDCAAQRDSIPHHPQTPCQPVTTTAAAPVDDKVQVNLEVSLAIDSTASFDDIKSQLVRHLTERGSTMRLREGPLLLPAGQHAFLDKHVSEIHISVDGAPAGSLGRCLFFWELDISVRC